MSIKISDPNLVEILRKARGDLNVTDAEGNLLGTFVAGGLFRPPPGYQPGVSEEEIQRRLNDKTPGRPLKDILRDLEARG
jgi:hypothetical protein